MKCTGCGKKIRKSDATCPHCGKALSPDVMDTQELMDTMGEMHNELNLIGEMRERRRIRKRRAWIALFVILLCLAGGFGAMYYFRGLGSTEEVVQKEETILTSAVPGETVNKFLGKSFVNIDITDENSAQSALETVQTQLGVTSDNITFRLDCKTKVGNDTYYRFQQMCEGIPVYGSEAVILADAEGTPVALHANLTETAGLDMTAELSAGNASNSISEYVNKMVETYRVSDGIRISEPEKIVCNFEGKTYLAYTANVSGYNDKGSYIGYDVFVDAKSGTGIFVFDTASYEEPTEDTETEEDLETSEEIIEDTDADIPEETDFAANFRMYTVNDKFGWNVPDKTGVLEEVSMDDLSNATKVINDTASSVEKAYNYFSDSFGWKGLDGEDKAFSVYLNANEYVKDRLPPEKALYSNDVLMFIETDTVEGVVDSNIVTHEYTHGVMQYAAGLAGTTAMNENAAIAEGLADIFGEFAEGDAPDWKHGERNFAEVQPGYYYEATDALELSELQDCYRYSTVISRMTYKMFAEGIGTKKLGELTFRTLLMMTGNDSFRDFGTLMEANAKLMQENGTLTDTQFEIVTTALTNAGLRGEKLYQTSVDEIVDESDDTAETDEEDSNEEDPNEKLID